MAQNIEDILDSRLLEALERLYDLLSEAEFEAFRVWALSSGSSFHRQVADEVRQDILDVIATMDETFRPRGWAFV